MFIAEEDDPLEETVERLNLEDLDSEEPDTPKGSPIRSIYIDLNGLLFYHYTL